MLFLWLSIGCTVAVYLLFRLFGKYKVDMLPAIVINYFTCAAFGHISARRQMLEYAQDIPDAQFHFAFLMGLAFVSIFYVLGLTTNLIGVSGSTIVSRMSMVIPTMYSVIWLGEDLHILKIIGIVLALAAIYFTVAPGKKNEEDAPRMRPAQLVFPILAFLGVGTVDTMLKISQSRFLGDKPDITFVGLIYNAAFILGVIFYLVSGKSWYLFLKGKNMLGGFVLGFFNFYGIVLIYKALTGGTMGGSTLFPINSVGTVALSTLAAVFLFREQLTVKKIIGLGLAITAILLIAWKDIFR